ncbi:MAG: cell division protein ZapA [Salibacteraceae bacterium]
MSELSIKVTIANRVYPLTILREEEEGIRKAAKMINEHMRDLEENYAVRDRQDLLAMTALEYATQALNAGDKGVADETTTGQLADIEKRLQEYLEQQ